jgi:hypothetical protein
MAAVTYAVSRVTNTLPVHLTCHIGALCGTASRCGTMLADKNGDAELAARTKFCDNPACLLAQDKMTAAAQGRSTNR